MGSNIQIGMTRHFETNYFARMGNWPTPAMLKKIVREGVRVQKGRDLRDLSGQPFRQLAIYWHPDLDIVVTIDTVKRPDWVAISCLSRENMSRIKTDGRRLKAEGKPKRKPRAMRGGNGKSVYRMPMAT